MNHPQLVVTKRLITGKKVKQLRHSGNLPANVYGKDVKSTAVQVPTKEFMVVYKEVGNGLIDLQLDGKTLPVLIHNVHKNYLRDEILHADFFQVNLKEKVKTNVPLVILGEAGAVTNNVGLLQQLISEVEVEALPNDLPENIEVNVAELTEVDEYIPVEELKAPAGVTILTDPKQVIVKITELISKEAEEDLAAAEAEAQAAKEEPAEGGAAAEEGKDEAAKEEPKSGETSEEPKSE